MYAMYLNVGTTGTSAGKDGIHIKYPFSLLVLMLIAAT